MVTELTKTVTKIVHEQRVTDFSHAHIMREPRVMNFDTFLAEIVSVFCN